MPTIPDRNERIAELHTDIDALEIKIEVLRHNAEQQRSAGRNLWKTEWTIGSIDADARKKESSAALMARQLGRLCEEVDRLESLTDK